VLFNVKRDILKALQERFGAGFRFTPAADMRSIGEAVNWSGANPQAFGIVSEEATGVVEISNPTSNLAVGTLQSFLDEFMEAGGAEKIDYVHGMVSFTRLARQPGNAGFFLPSMDKNDLFKTVILDGALPRKTFSMGEANEKRFYMESRRIVP
jgi:hypothetical protein